MLTIAWKFLNNQEVTNAMTKLYRTNKLSANTAYRVGRLCTRFQKEMERARIESIALLEKHAVRDDKGAVKNFPNGPYEFPTPEIEKQHDAEFAKLMETTFDEKVNKLSLSDLNEVGLTPAEINAISDLLEV